MRKLLLGAGLGIIAVVGWRALVERAGRPLTELDELYPPPGDLRLEEMFSGFFRWPRNESGYVHTLPWP